MKNLKCLLSASMLSLMPVCGVYSADTNFAVSPPISALPLPGESLQPKRNANVIDKSLTDSKSEPAAERKAPLVEHYLLSGQLANGESSVVTYLNNHPKDDEARFGLGVLQFLRAVELLSQNLYRYGMRPDKGVLPGEMITRLPISDNPHPLVMTYTKFRQITDVFRVGILKSESTLSKISSPNVKLPLHFNMIKLDLNGDGRCDESERFWRIYKSVASNSTITAEGASDFVVCFDRGDVHWLRGYSHLLSGLIEVYLAYDSHEAFEHAAHVLFKKVQSPYHFLKVTPKEHSLVDRDVYLLDLVAAIHAIHWAVVEPQRMKNALHHFEAVVAQSHETWRWILAETDDDREWLPNPAQTGVIDNVKVTQKMVDSWQEVMTEIGKLLAGDLLIPFWRGDRSVGINLRLVFLKPTTLDAVYWIEGTAAAPYLQKGPCTNRKIWNHLESDFNNNFPGFAAWFN